MIDFTFSRAKWSNDSEGFWISFLVPESAGIKEFADNANGKYTATIKKYRNKRSLNANAYAWVLITRIADALRADKDEVYFEMLRRYGQSNVISVAPEVPIGSYVKYYELFGVGTAGGRWFNHYKVYKGSSEYDTREMSVFIDGIVSECKEMGIETLTPCELAFLKEGWQA